VTVIEYKCLRDLRPLNDGAFGIVYRAEHRQWGTVAYKQLKAAYIQQESKSVTCHCQDYLRHRAHVIPDVYWLATRKLS